MVLRATESHRFQREDALGRKRTPGVWDDTNARTSVPQWRVVCSRLEFLGCRVWCIRITIVAIQQHCEPPNSRRSSSFNLITNCLTETSMPPG